MLHPKEAGPVYTDEYGDPAQLVVCPDCAQMEWWTQTECIDHGLCRTGGKQCWCE